MFFEVFYVFKYLIIEENLSPSAEVFFKKKILCSKFIKTDSLKICQINYYSYNLAFSPGTYMKKKRIALYPGTFDPVTFGHIDIMRRALKLFDQVIVAVALNPNKSPLFCLEERVHFIKDATKKLKNLEVIAFDNLLISLAHDKKASVVIKGLRAISDFEFELQMGLMNRTLDENIETLFMIPSQEFSFLSSSLVKEIARHGGDVSKLIPKNVLKELKKNLG